MDFEFYLDEKYVAFYILNRKMHDEENEISTIKEKLLSNNSLGYRKIINEILLDVSVYSSDFDINNLIQEFVTSEEFKKFYKKYGTKDTFSTALDLLTNRITTNDNSLTEIKNYLWNKHRNGYIKIKDNFDGMVEKYLEDTDVKKIIDEFISTNEFQKIFLETQKYMELVKKEWELSKIEINEFLSKILKTNFSIKPKVYIVHPNCYKGCNYNKNNIIWGHFRGINDPNYNLTYLVHEGLHCLLPYSISNLPESENIIHAIIELSSDYELYSKLKNESTIEEGHPFLRPYKKTIYPFWLEYIGLNLDEKTQREQKDNMVSSTINNETIKNMNIIEFIYYCYKEYEQNYKPDEKHLR